MAGLNYKINVSWDYITIFINDIIHLQFPFQKMAVQTWIDQGAITVWKIQFVNFETGKFVCTAEYNSQQKWTAILELWNNKFN